MYTNNTAKTLLQSLKKNYCIILNMQFLLPGCLERCQIILKYRLPHVDYTLKMEVEGC
jgi:hypothetical protein